MTTKVDQILAAQRSQKRYECNYCHEKLTHAEARHHWDICPKRPKETKLNG